MGRGPPLGGSFEESRDGGMKRMPSSYTVTEPPLYSETSGQTTGRKEDTYIRTQRGMGAWSKVKQAGTGAISKAQK